MTEVWIYVISCSAVIFGKNFNVGHCMQTFQPDFKIAGMKDAVVIE